MTSRNAVWHGHTVARAAAGVSALVALVVLAGSALGNAALTTLLPGGAQMAPATAFAFLFGAIALGLNGEQRFAMLAQLCAFAVLLTGALRLGAYALELSNEVDSAAGPVMASATAFNFMLLGAALALAHRASGAIAAQTLGVVVMLVGWLGLAHYMYGSEQVTPYAPMAIHSAILFLLLGAGVISIHKEVGLMRLLGNTGAGGASARRLLPAAVILPLALSFVPAYAQHLGWIGSDVGLTSFALSNVVAFGVLVGLNAVYLERADAQRRDAQNELRASAQQLQMLAESLPNLVWTSRADGVCDYLSRQWAEYTGRPESEQLGAGWIGNVHPEDRAQAHADWAAAITCGDSFDVEFRIRRADGAYRWFRSRAVPLHDATGQVVKWFGSSTDIEDYKLAERKLRTQLERLRLLDRTTRAIADRQDTGSILEVVLRNLEDNMPIDFGCVCFNDAARSTLTVACVGARSRTLAGLLGMLPNTVIDVDSKCLARCVRGELVHEPDLAQVDSGFTSRLALADLGSLVIAPLLVESKVFGVLIAARRGAGQFSGADCEFLRQLSEHAALVMRQADLYGALQVAYDDLRETQQRVMQQERLRALGQLASGIAHDINNALSPASLYAQTLLRHDESLGDEAREYLVIIQRAIEDVAHTVTRMKEFCRQREPELVHSPVDLNVVVEHVLALTHARWHDMPQERGIVIRLETRTAPDLPKIMGVETELRDSLTNLVLNAVDAMPEGGTLTVRTRATGATTVAVEVSDTGIGMDQATRNRCLEPFFTTKGERGTGLGLAMVYGMLERHSGEIEIDSERGRGTTMRLVFPASADALSAGVDPTMTLRTLRLHLLLIDDDPMVLRSLQEVLLHEGHLVSTADGGASGIEIFQNAEAHDEPFSLVITDLGMPHIDGRKVAAAVKAAAPHVPVVLLTGWGHRLLAEGDTPEYVDRVLSKPPKMAELRRALAELTNVSPALTNGSPAKATSARRLCGSPGIQ